MSGADPATMAMIAAMASQAMGSRGSAAPGQIPSIPPVSISNPVGVTGPGGTPPFVSPALGDQSGGSDPFATLIRLLSNRSFGSSL